MAQCLLVAVSSNGARHAVHIGVGHRRLLKSVTACSAGLRLGQCRTRARLCWRTGSTPGNPELAAATAAATDSSLTDSPQWPAPEGAPSNRPPPVTSGVARLPRPMFAAGISGAGGLSLCAARLWDCRWSFVQGCATMRATQALLTATRTTTTSAPQDALTMIARSRCRVLVVDSCPMRHRI